MNSLNDSIKIAVDLAILKAERPETQCREMHVTSGIRITVVVEPVLHTVNLNDEVMLQAHKIEDVAIPWRLPPKMEPLRSQCTKGKPEMRFLRRQGLSQTSRHFSRHG